MSDKLIKLTNVSFPTAVFHSKALFKTANPPVFVFIPGNPGLVGFYIEYLTFLQQMLPKIEVLAISYAGFTEDTPLRDPGVIGLKEQTEHKIEVMSRFITKDHGDVILFGHSCGGYIAQQTVLQLSLLNDPLLNKIKQVGLLMPAISDLALSPSGISLARVFKWIPNFHILVSKLTYLLKLIPRSILMRIVRFQLGTSSRFSIMEAMKLVTSPHLIVKTLGLAKEELRVIDLDESRNETFFDILLTKGIPFYGGFCQSDHWLANSTRAFLIEKYSNSNNVFQIVDDISIEHNFCVNSSEAFALITANALKKFKE